MDNRITADRFKKAMEANQDLVLTYNAWTTKEEGVCKACAASLVAITEGKITFGDLHLKINKEMGARVLSEVLELPMSYLSGFAKGFDNNRTDTSYNGNGEYTQGYADGVYARELSGL
jgi:hypothetical protein